MRWLFRAFIALVLLGMAAAAAVVYLAVEPRPLVEQVRPLTPEQVERATQVMRAHDPRRLATGQVGRVTVDQDDIALALSHLLSRVGTGAARVRIEDGSLALQATVELPRNPLARYVNVDAVLAQGNPMPGFATLKVGRLPVPRMLANALVERALVALYADPDARDASRMIREVRLRPGRMQITYRWQEDAAKRLRARLVPEADQSRMRDYNDHLVRVARDLAPGAGLDRLLEPLLQLAAERSFAGAEAADENRAALIVLEAYVNGRDLGTLVPQAREWHQARTLAPTIQGRRDFAQHFMTSAVLAVLGGTALSDAVGLYKEIDDSRGGSGFSFTDLAADRAGTRFGELCVRSRADARRVQTAAQSGLTNEQLMPAVLDLPEHMNEAEFTRRFGGTDDPRYRQVLQEIERRVSALDFYR